MKKFIYAICLGTVVLVVPFIIALSTTCVAFYLSAVHGLAWLSFIEDRIFFLWANVIIFWLGGIVAIFVEYKYRLIRRAIKHLF